MSSAHTPPTEAPQVVGDGITIATATNGDSVTLTAHDSVRNCTKSIVVPTRDLTHNSDQVRANLLHLLAQELNGRPIKVGTSKSDPKSSGTMPR